MGPWSVGQLGLKIPKSAAPERGLRHPSSGADKQADTISSRVVFTHTGARFRVSVEPCPSVPTLHLLPNAFSPWCCALECGCVRQGTPLSPPAHSPSDPSYLVLRAGMLMRVKVKGHDSVTAMLSMATALSASIISRKKPTSYKRVEGRDGDPYSMAAGRHRWWSPACCGHGATLPFPSERTHFGHYPRRGFQAP